MGASIELRINHDVECDWGPIGGPPLIVCDYVTQTVTIENVAPLILVSKDLADGGRPDSPFRDACTFYTDGGRRFMRIDADNGSWTWELFPTHWSDDVPSTVYAGRWPD